MSDQCPDCGQKLHLMYDGGDKSKPCLGCLCGYSRSAEKPPEYHGEPAPAPKVSRRKHVDLEGDLALQIKAAGLPEPERQYPLVNGRKFKGDFVWLEKETCYPYRIRGIVCEVQGKVHTIEEQWHRDCARLNCLTEAGWRVFFVTGRDIRSGKAIALLERVLK